MSLFLRNLLAVILPAAMGTILSLILNNHSPLVSGTWFYSLLFLILLSLILNLVYAFHAGSKTFTELLIATIVIKFLLTLIAIVIYSFIDKPGFFNFSLHMVMHYILFTIFEIRYLLYILKTHPIKHN